MVHSLFLVIEIFIGILFVFACWTRPRQPHLPAVTTRKLTSEPAQAASAPMSSSTPLKRRHSMQDKPLHDHHIQELNAVKHRRSSLDCMFTTHSRLEPLKTMARTVTYTT